jgi:aerobic C4-dicarboxylate transport protein
MSEARAVTNFSGNAVATVLVGSWTKTIDRSKVNAVLDGEDPFDELTMLDDDRTPRAEEPAQEKVPALA